MKEPCQEGGTNDSDRGATPGREVEHTRDDRADRTIMPHFVPLSKPAEDSHVGFARPAPAQAEGAA